MKQGQSSLRYVGSPYQTSLSEAGQVKYLYEMTSEQIESPLSESTRMNRKWLESERWEIDLGKKYYKVVTDNCLLVGDHDKGDDLMCKLNPLYKLKIHLVLIYGSQYVQYSTV